MINHDRSRYYLLGIDTDYLTNPDRIDAGLTPISPMGKVRPRELKYLAPEYQARELGFDLKWSDSRTYVFNSYALLPSI